MSPRRLQPDLVLVRLSEIDRLLDDLTALGPVIAEQLRLDRHRRHVVERVLTPLVDLAVGANAHIAASRGDATPTDYRLSFAAVAATGAINTELAVRLAPSAGLRNVLTHLYLEVDLDGLAAAVPIAMTDYREYVRQVAGYLQRAADEG